MILFIVMMYEFQVKMRWKGTPLASRLEAAQENRKCVSMRQLEKYPGQSFASFAATAEDRKKHGMNAGNQARYHNL
jgi:hypothetical protein